jgi:Peptidase inhibitor family I36
MPRRHLTTSGVVVGAVLLLGSVSASAQTWGRPRVPAAGACFYEDIDFGGRYFCSRAGDVTASVPPGTNDRISSIRLFGDSEVIVFQHIDFRGASRRLDSNVRDLRRSGWNDRISSYRIERRAYNGGGDEYRPVWGRPQVPQTGACFYKDINYRGDYFCVPRGSSVRQVPRGTNDKISSIRLFGGATVTVYRDINFNGQSSHFTDDMRDLRTVGWNDLISSFRIDARGFDRDRRRDDRRP